MEIYSYKYNERCNFLTINDELYKSIITWRSGGGFYSTANPSICETTPEKNNVADNDLAVGKEPERSIYQNSSFAGIAIALIENGSNLFAGNVFCRLDIAAEKK